MAMRAVVTQVDYRRVVDAQESEKAFQARVVELARACRWLVFHPYDSRHSEAGYPDLTLCRKKRLIMVELKSQRGRLSPAQKAWGTALQATNRVEYYVWKPSDWETIEDVLAPDRVQKDEAA